MWKEATEEALKEVQKAGVKIYYPDKNLFEEKVKPLIEEYRNEPSVYNLIKQIKMVDYNE